MARAGRVTVWLSLSALVLTTGALLAQTKSPSRGSIQGVWRVSEATRPGVPPVTDTKPQPGQWIFTARHHSVVSVLAGAPRPNLPQDQTKATAAELLAVYGPFAAQSGTYEASGGILTLHPFVAKGPAVMAPGSVHTWTYTLDGQSLTLTQKTDHNGPITRPATVKLRRVE